MASAALWASREYQIADNEILKRKLRPEPTHGLMIGVVIGAEGHRGLKAMGLI